MNVCLICGQEGFTNAFVYCVNCLNYAVHRYCMAVLTFNEFVPWHCVDCEVILEKSSAHHNCDPVTCNRGDHTISKDMEVFPGELNKCDDILAFETERHVYEGGPRQQSPEAGLKECSESGRGNTRSIAEKDQPGSGKQRDHKHCSQQSSESDSEPCTGEHNPLERKASFQSSKKMMKTAEFCEANSEKEGRNSNPSNTKIDMMGIHSANQNVSNFNEAPQYLPDVPLAVDGHVDSQPVFTPIWRGSFNIQNTADGMLDEFVAHMSNKACQKVYDEASQLYGLLCLEMLPKAHVWPKSFWTSPPSADNIALYFFPSDTRYERIFDHLVEDMMDKELAMKAVCTNAELLIFTSVELPPEYWRFQGKYYLWGVFRNKKVSSHELDDHPPNSTRTRNNNPVSNCSNDLDASRGKNTLKTKIWGSPLSPLSNRD